jgi:hypothetical protein
MSKEMKKAILAAIDGSDGATAALKQAAAAASADGAQLVGAECDTQGARFRTHH